MKITTDVIITKVDVKKKKDSQEQYLMISMLDKNSGDVFEIIEKDMEYMMKLQAMKIYNLTLDLSSSKYGLRLAVVEIKKEIGQL